ncbi:MAG: TonB-dependent receptor plug domain-containing protein [Saprospiraceae bacterium]
MKKILLLFVFLAASSWMMAQRTVTGTVTDTGGDPLIGANVIALGTTVGTITDIDGNFTINMPAGNNTIVVSYIGYEDQNIDVTGLSNVSVTMREGTLLEEVVVTALGIEKSEKSLGYSATTVSSEELTQTRNNSFADAISGRVAGVTINSNGAPGGSTSIVMRGFSSATGNNEALIVIDGIPILNKANRGLTQVLNANDDFNRSQDFGTQANDINPDDIESMTILKGAAATALYGSAAANGAIIITTKSGKLNQPLRVDYSGTISQSRVNRLPHLQNTFGQGWNGLWASNENGSWGPKADGVERLWGNTVNNSRKLKPYTIQEDNLRDFYDYGSGINNSIAISGGNENSTFRISYSNAQEDGIVPTNADSYKLNSLGLNGKLKSGRFSVGSNVTFSNKKQKSVATGQGDDAGAGSVLFQEIIQIPRDHSIVDYKDINDPFNNLDNFFTPYAQNPYYILDAQGNDYNEDRIRGSVDVGYDLFTNLKAQVRVGGDFSNSNLQDWGNVAIITPGSSKFIC